MVNVEVSMDLVRTICAVRVLVTVEALLPIVGVVAKCSTVCVMLSPLLFLPLLHLPQTQMESVEAGLEIVVKDCVALPLDIAVQLLHIAVLVVS